MKTTSGQVPARLALTAAASVWRERKAAEKVLEEMSTSFLKVYV